jgi:penicillin-insensitive murein endopeptidase
MLVAMLVCLVAALGLAGAPRAPAFPSGPVIPVAPTDAARVVPSVVPSVVASVVPSVVPTDLRSLTAAVWSRQQTPARGPARAIGGTSSGCLQGGKALPEHGPGFEVFHRSRHRFFGHPTLITYIRRLGASARQKRLGAVAIGDLSQARGGPTPSGHRSHQSGLDVDVWYTAPPRGASGAVGLAPEDRERLVAPAVVDTRTHEMTALWSRRAARLLALAAADPSVDRIFVNPAVKRALCAGPERHASWFARLRPWWGHQDHFHVRLRCPADSELCQPQAPPAPEPDDGCGSSLAWWFSPAGATAPTPRAPADQATPEGGGPKPPSLPEACLALVRKPVGGPSGGRAMAPATSTLTVPERR